MKKLISFCLFSALSIGCFAQETRYNPMKVFRLDGTALEGNYKMITSPVEALALFTRDDRESFPEFTKNLPVNTYGFLDTAAGKVLPGPKGAYLGAGSFGSGLAPVLESDPEGRYGYIDTKGRLAIPYQFLTAETFRDGYAAVRDLLGQAMVIDKSGKAVTTPFYGDILEISKGYGVFYNQFFKKYFAWDLKNNKAVIMQDNRMSLIELGDRVYIDPRTNVLLDTTGKPVFTGKPGGLFYTSEDNQNLLWVEYITKEAQVLGPKAELKGTIKYDQGFSYVMNGPYVVTSAQPRPPLGNFGTSISNVLNLSGEVLKIPGYPNYTGTNCLVNWGTLVGLMDVATKKWVIWPGFQKIYLVSKDFFRVISDKYSYLIHGPTGKRYLEGKGGSILWVSGGVAAVFSSKASAVESAPQQSAPGSEISYPENHRTWGLLSDSDVRIRSTPGADGAVIKTLPENSRVKILGLIPDWVKVGPWEGCWVHVKTLGPKVIESESLPWGEESQAPVVWGTEEEWSGAQEGWIFSPFILWFNYVNDGL